MNGGYGVGVGEGVTGRREVGWGVVGGKRTDGRW